MVVGITEAAASITLPGIRVRLRIRGRLTRFIEEAGAVVQQSQEGGVVTHASRAQHILELGQIGFMAWGAGLVPGHQIGRASCRERVSSPV